MGFRLMKSEKVLHGDTILFVHQVPITFTVPKLTRNDMNYLFCS